MPEDDPAPTVDDSGHDEKPMSNEDEEAGRGGVEVTEEEAQAHDKPPAAAEKSSATETAKDVGAGVAAAKDDDDFKDSLEPMPVKTLSEHADSLSPSKRRNSDWKEWLDRHRVLPRKYRLSTEKNTRKYSMWTLQFSVLCSAINTKMLNPNYPLMVSGLHPESFPNTDPFDFNSATYFIPMMSLLGVAISSTIVGQLSDRVGRKKPILIMAIISGIGSIVKFFARETFWGFCIANLVFGFFLGNLPIAMAYVGDVFTSKVDKEKQLGILVGNFVMGNSGGGMIAILMKNSGLFAPLWVGAGLMFVASALIVPFLIEPGDTRMLPLDEKRVPGDDEEDEKRPETINQLAMWNVIGGALADNFGSTALFPLCLSPLALEQYTFNFVSQGLEPIMSFTGYQWLSVCVALMVVPSTIITPYIFALIGAAGTCVLGNACTALLTMALLFIGNGPATTAAFAGFVTVLYLGFPVTVFSQLTTGPMLDVLAPESKIGFVQGLNNSAMNFGMAIAPWLFGVLADATTTNIAIWTGIGISFGAAAINAPLMWRKEMGPPEKKPPPEKRILPGEDEEFAQKALDGSFVPPAVLLGMNRMRAFNDKPFIVPSVKPYEEDKDSLDELRAHATENFLFRKDLNDRALAELNSPNPEKDVDEICRLLNVAIGCDPETEREQTENLGKWIGDYLLDNGYHPHINSVLMKHMVMTAFPSIMTDKEYTPENIEAALVRRRQIFNLYLEVQERKKYSLTKVVGNGATPQFYS